MFNNFSSSDPNASDFNTSMFASKGSAAPSPDRQMEKRDIPQSIFPSKQENVNKLSGLIKRVNPVRKIHIHTEPSQIIRRPENPVPNKNHDLIDMQSHKQPHKQPRRQLTVRIESNLFQELKTFAKSTGKSYQEIQSHALNNLFSNLQKD